ncbi:MAG: WYL domain-containing protein [Coriobacteriales bacterium]|nr:WYL domain-containing protein [Coriobacteriales bacterium]
MARTSASDRARRLVALLGQLQRAEEPIPLESLAASVGTAPAELERDLTSLSMCGVAPYSPLELMPVIVDDGMVEVVGTLPGLRGPSRLSAREATALATALQTAGFADDDPLVERLLSASAADLDTEQLGRALRSTVTAHASEVYEQLARACEESEVVAIAYQRGGDSDLSVRRIEPIRLIAERGVWYVSAYCRVANGTRTFRLDRIRGVEPTGERFAPRTGQPALHAFDAEGLPAATLAFADPDLYHGREWPASTVAGTDARGRLLVEVPFAGTSWIARKVAALLGDVEVVEPAEVRRAVVDVAKAELDALEA